MDKYFLRSACTFPATLLMHFDAFLKNKLLIPIFLKEVLDFNCLVPVAFADISLPNPVID